MALLGIGLRRTGPLAFSDSRGLLPKNTIRGGSFSLLEGGGSPTANCYVSTAIPRFFSVGLPSSPTLLPPRGEGSTRFPSPEAGRGARGEGKHTPPSTPALLPPRGEGSMRFPSPETGRGVRGEGRHAPPPHPRPIPWLAHNRNFPQKHQNHPVLCALVREGLRPAANKLKK